MVRAARAAGFADALADIGAVRNRSPPSETEAQLVRDRSPHYTFAWLVFPPLDFKLRVSSASISSESRSADALAYPKGL